MHRSFRTCGQAGVCMVGLILILEDVDTQIKAHTDHMHRPSAYKLAPHLCMWDVGWHETRSQSEIRCAGIWHGSLCLETS